MKKTKTKPTKTKTPKGTPRKVGRIDMRERPEIVKALEDALIGGLSIRKAVVIAGISEPTFFHWIKEGSAAKPGTLASEFFKRMEKARAIPVQRNLLLIQRAAPKNWQAAAWYLERCHSEEFGRRFFQVEHVGKDQGPIKVEVAEQPIDLSNLSDEELRVLRAMKRKLKKPNQ